MNTSSRLLCFVSLFVISWILLQAPPDFDRYAPVLEILNDPNASRCLIQYKYSASGKPSGLCLNHSGFTRLEHIYQHQGPPAGAACSCNEIHKEVVKVRFALLDQPQNSHFSSHSLMTSSVGPHS